MARHHIYHPSVSDPKQTVGSYWQSTADQRRSDSAPLEGDASCDVVIIGAGITGLNAGLRLAGVYGRAVRVLEMGAVGFGASGRNGGFVCTPACFPSWTEVAARFGIEAAREFYCSQNEAISHVDALISKHDLDHVRHGVPGELELAHTPSAFDGLVADARTHEAHFGEAPRILDRSELAAFGFSNPDVHGAALHPHGFAVHPLNLVYGLAQAAVSDGVVLHPYTEATAVVAGSRRRYRVTAQRGSIEADHVLFAMNGYVDESLHPWLRGRVMPALSSIIVTAPISAERWAEAGFVTDIMSFDTRTLLHYFRRLPDGRMLFGGRGGVTAEPSKLVEGRVKLRADFDQMFPALSDVETTHGWSGLVALTRDGFPHIGPLPGEPGLWASFAYHGNGIATGCWAGAQMADMIADKRSVADLPAVLQAAARRIPFPVLRPLYLRAAYTAFAWKDRS